ncbi:MAG TPA: hypothetical protein VGE22_13495, partial [Solimonas sp.]
MATKSGMSIIYITFSHFLDAIVGVLLALGLRSPPPLTWKDGNRHKTRREYLAGAGRDLREAYRRPLDWVVNRRWRTGRFWPDQGE